jgi:3-hydroxyacyl-[acyl-carrier-protein] dehydratase
VNAVAAHTTLLDHAAIRELLPQGHPMVLVDRVVALDPQSSITGLKAITGGEPCYRDLVPGAPRERTAYPVSLMLESFGQTAAILWLTGMGGAPVRDDRVLMLVAIRDCAIHGSAYPGDVLRHVASIEAIIGDNVFVAGEILVEDRRVATVGSMMAVLRPRTVLSERANAQNTGTRPEGDAP